MGTCANLELGYSRTVDKNVNALMDEVTYERLRTASFETRKSMSEIIREALALWFDQGKGTQS